MTPFHYGQFLFSGFKTIVNLGEILRSTPHYPPTWDFGWFRTFHTSPFIYQILSEGWSLKDTINWGSVNIFKVKSIYLKWSEIKAKLKSFIPRTQHRVSLSPFSHLFIPSRRSEPGKGDDDETLIIHFRCLIVFQYSYYKYWLNIWVSLWVYCKSLT